MADFSTSTHRTKWLFTPEILAERYKASNQRARQTLEKYGATRMEVDADGSLLYRESQTNSNADRHSRKKALTIEEEQFLRMYFETKLREVCGAFYFPHKIQGTALIYFKRFYLHWSVMEHHPRDIILTCIYTACKIEENHVSAEELAKGLSQDHHVILNNEMLVLQSLDFDLIVYAPYRAIEGFMDDMEDYFRDNEDQLQMLKEAGVAEVDKIMLTDAPLLFPPGQLALAALRCANEVHGVVDFERYLENMLSHQNSFHAFQELKERLNEIEELVKGYKFPTEKDMRHINRKLQSCWGLSSNDDKKREKKSKHRSRQSSNEAQNGSMLYKLLARSSTPTEELSDLG